MAGAVCDICEAPLDNPASGDVCPECAEQVKASYELGLED